jgi:glutathione synthase/RimK-type ligase-like ATP-grasp enzyme
VIVLWGLGSERTLRAVATALQRRGTPAQLIDQAEMRHTSVQLDVGPRVRGSVQTRSETIPLESVTAAYVRPYDSRRLAEDAGARRGDATWRHALAVDDALASWSELTPALVVNRLGAMAGNSSKPYQLQQIARLGFRVPDTLVTTDPRQARAFWQRHGAVVYKSVSGVRSRVARLRPRDRARLSDVATCPTQFQEFVEGRDHRVHVVDGEVFASTVACDADDYRYARGRPVEIRACTLPPEMEDRCRELASALDLPVAGIDLRRRADGAWYCFEVNPSPAFVFYEEATQQPIADAIARLLATPRARCYDARRRA